MRYMHKGLNLNQDQKTKINKTPASPRLPLPLLTREGKEAQVHSRSGTRTDNRPFSPSGPTLRTRNRRI